MQIQLIGRQKEQEVLRKALYSNEAEMISVIGRRRVGKTFLIKKTYGSRIVFDVSGIQHAPKEEQLRNFARQLVEAAPDSLITQPPKDWLDAFFQLATFLKQVDLSEKKVVFFDELPWMATHKSGFLRGLSWFWNSWAVNHNIVVVICGSAASWMINKVIKHKGGLHNRVTKRIHLKPFSLAETEEYLTNRHIHFDHYQLIQLYMAMGGIPHYLKEIESGQSAIQNIDRICFAEDGLLQDEFVNLYPALFQNADDHIAIIRALATTHKGLSRKKILEIAKLVDGGKPTRVLTELEQSGFISSYFPFGKKKKGKLYRLTDAYSLFYLQFIEKNIQQGGSVWQTLSQTQAWKSWSGYAFENICLQHVQQIKQALGISGVYSISSSFFKQGSETEAGTQIDLVIDRNDHVINLFEIKFYNTKVSISKAYAEILREKIRVFQETTKTRKYISLAMISTFGLTHNKHSLGLITNEFSMDVLFAKPYSPF